MDSLDRAVELISRWKVDRQKQRAEVLTRLDAVAKECQSAVQVWQGYLDKPGAPGDQWAIVSWIGPERAKQLHEIDLRAKAEVAAICRLAGPQAGRFIALEGGANVIEMAYRMLNPGESGTDAAKTAVQRQHERLDYIRGLMQRVRAGKPAGKTAPAKKSASAKGKKKAAAKSVKKKAPKKK
jgi:hypothetical protein